MKQNVQSPFSPIHSRVIRLFNLFMPRSALLCHFHVQYYPTDLSPYSVTNRDSHLFDVILRLIWHTYFFIYLIFPPLDRSDHSLPFFSIHSTHLHIGKNKLPATAHDKHTCISLTHLRTTCGVVRFANNFSILHPHDICRWNNSKITFEHALNTCQHSKLPCRTWHSFCVFLLLLFFPSNMCV